MSLVSLAGYTKEPLAGTRTAMVPHSLLRAHLGRPPGWLLDAGGALTPLVGPLQREGWVLHTTCRDAMRLKDASRSGVRVARRAPVHQLPFGDNEYDCGVMTLTRLDDIEGAIAELKRVCCAGAPVVISTALQQDATPLRDALAENGMMDVSTYVDDGSSLVLHIGQQGPLLVTARLAGDR